MFSPFILHNVLSAEVTFKLRSEREVRVMETKFRGRDKGMSR